MTEQETINYNRIAAAIEYIQTHFKHQPGLDEVAESIHLSPYHFQRLFTEWAGTSPKKFLQYLSIEHAKKLLREGYSSVPDAAYATGLSGTGRLHDLFISIEGMTPAEYRNGGRSLSINYSFAESPFGDLLVASTQKGICYMAFADNKMTAFADLQQHFPDAAFRQMVDINQQNALFIFSHDLSRLPEVKLHLKCTDFQLKVWQTLLQIPLGHISSYGTIAAQIQKPFASRAVGTAIGSNPVAYLIPCHRVIQATGAFGGYMWGSTRKAAIIGWEAAKTNQLVNG